MSELPVGLASAAYPVVWVLGYRKYKELPLLVDRKDRAYQQDEACICMKGTPCRIPDLKGQDLGTREGELSAVGLPPFPSPPVGECLGGV